MGKLAKSKGLNAAVVETTEVGYKLRDCFQVFRGDPSNAKSELIAVGTFFNAIAFCENDIRIDYFGEEICIHEDYCKIHH